MRWAKYMETKTLIIYASKYGCAQKCAEILSKKIDGPVDLVNIQGNVSDLSTLDALEQYDKVVIGGSIRFGQVQKLIQEFCDQNFEKLKGKRFGLFICCGLLDDASQQMQNSFPKELLDLAVTKECFGGELDIDKMSFIDKIIVRIVIKTLEKQGKKMPIVFNDHIQGFTQMMNSI